MVKVMILVHDTFINLIVTRDTDHDANSNVMY